MQAHQERVMIERDDLALKIARLESFLTGGIFSTLPVEEQTRLMEQHGHMKKYHDVLFKRISAFE